MAKEYKPSDVLTFAQLAALRQIVRDAKRRHRTPHAELMRYIAERPEILAKCERVGLLPDFFAYQLEALFDQ